MYFGRCVVGDGQSPMAEAACIAAGAVMPTNPKCPGSSSGKYVPTRTASPWSISQSTSDNHLKFSLQYPNLDIGQLEDPVALRTFSISHKDAVAGAAGVTSDDITILDIVAGSVAVSTDVAFNSRAPGDTFSKTLTLSSVDTVQELFSSSSVASSEPSTPVAVLNVQWEDNSTSTSPPCGDNDDGKSDDDTILLLGGGFIGGIAITVVAMAVALHLRQKNNVNKEHGASREGHSVVNVMTGNDALSWPRGTYGEEKLGRGLKDVEAGAVVGVAPILVAVTSSPEHNGAPASLTKVEVV